MSKRKGRTSINDKLDALPENRGRSIFDPANNASGEIFSPKPESPESSIMGALYGDSAPSADELEKRLQETQENAVMLDGDRISFYGLRVTPTGIDFENTNVTKEILQKAIVAAVKLDSTVQWVIGDLLAYAEKQKWQDVTYSTIAEQTGRKIETLYEYKHVAFNVQFLVRTKNLSYGHHKIVASMKPSEQRQWLQYAEEHGLSVSALRKAIQQSGKSTTKKQSWYVPRFNEMMAQNHDAYKKTWRKMSNEKRRELYAYLDGLLREMEAWGFDNDS